MQCSHGQEMMYDEYNTAAEPTQSVTQTIPARKWGPEVRGQPCRGQPAAVNRSLPTCSQSLKTSRRPHGFSCRRPTRPAVHSVGHADDAREFRLREFFRRRSALLFPAGADPPALAVVVLLLRPPPLPPPTIAATSAMLPWSASPPGASYTFATSPGLQHSNTSHCRHSHLRRSAASPVPRLPRLRSPRRQLS